MYADQGGAVVIPRDAVDRVLDEGVDIEAEDEAYKEQVRSEDREAVLDG